MQAERTLFDMVLGELRRFLEGVGPIPPDESHVDRFLRDIGWNPQALSGLPALVGACSEMSTLFSQPDASPPSLRDVPAFLARIGSGLDLVRKFDGNSAGHPALPELGADLAEQLSIKYIVVQHPVLWRVMVLLGLADDASNAAPIAPIVVDGIVLRRAIWRPRLRFDGLASLVRDPGGFLASRYLPHGLVDAAAADALAGRLFPLLVALVDELGGDAIAGFGQAPELALDAAAEGLARRMLSIAFPGPLGTMLGATLLVDPPDSLDLGVALMPFGSATLARACGAWEVRAHVDTSVRALSINSEGVTLLTDGTADAAFAFDASVRRHSSAVAPLRIGGASGTRVEIGSVQLAAMARYGATDQRWGIEWALDPVTLVIEAGDGDGFLQSVLPAGGIRANLGLTLGWESSRGLYFRGGTSNGPGQPIERDFALDIDVAGVLRLTGLHAEIAAGADRVDGSLSVSAALSLGPLDVQADQIGIALSVVPKSDGNLGPLDLGLAFKPPGSLALGVASDVVQGRGMIQLDPLKQQYSGGLTLKVRHTIDIAVIGILNARLPSNRPGFSLLLIVTAQFPPIQLGLGFTLNGVGGLLGINRTAAVDVLRAGLRNGMLDTVLFPPDPLANVPALLGSLGALFPVAEGRYVFGPMVRLGWGAPTILTLDLAVVIELPDPVRLIILGRLLACLPDADNPLVVIRMDAVGVIDFGRGTLALDATLYDSRILSFAVSGDMALRLAWGDKPDFILSVGGFHPHFAAPAGMPRLGRLALTLVDAEKDGLVARVRLESYLALTSNTVQFGARVDAYFKALGVELYGFLSFDALLQTAPLALEVELAAAVALAFEGVMLMGAEVVLTLTGPTPWHLVGEARFALLGAKLRAPIDLRIGAAVEPPPPVPATDVKALLLQAVQDARNWQALPPATADGMVMLRQPTAPATSSPTTLTLHPLGALALRQRVLPLRMQIHRYANAPVMGDRFFDLAFGAGVGAVDDLNEPFAIAQFTPMHDDERLAASSFEPRKAGLRTRSADFVSAASVKTVPALDWETATLLPAGEPGLPIPLRTAPMARSVAGVDAASIERLIALGAAAHAPVRAQGKSRYFAVRS